VKAQDVAFRMMNIGLLLGAFLAILGLILTFIPGNQRENVIFISGLLLLVNLSALKLRLYMNSNPDARRRAMGGGVSNDT
jgi:hypothetical protein